MSTPTWQLLCDEAKAAVAEDNELLDAAKRDGRTMLNQSEAIRHKTLMTIVHDCNDKMRLQLAELNGRNAALQEQVKKLQHQG